MNLIDGYIASRYKEVDLFRRESYDWNKARQGLPQSSRFTSKEYSLVYYVDKYRPINVRSVVTQKNVSVGARYGNSIKFTVEVVYYQMYIDKMWVTVNKKRLPKKY